MDRDTEMDIQMFCFDSKFEQSKVDRMQKKFHLTLKSHPRPPPIKLHSANTQTLPDQSTYLQYRMQRIYLIQLNQISDMFNIFRADPKLCGL